MTMRSYALIIGLAVLGLGIFGCDAITGGDAPPQPLPGVAPLPPGVPGQPGMPPAYPGQPAPAMPGQPVPAMPGQPAPAMPGQPAPAMPGQPIAAPGMPAPPPTPAVPGAPVAPVMPGQPAPLAGAPAAPAPAQPAAPPAPTGDPLIDKLNATQAAQAGDKTGTSSMLRQTLEAGKTQSYYVQLPGPPYCHAYIVVGDDQVTNLDVSIEGPTSAGTPEAQDETQEPIAVVQNHCPAVPGQYKLNVTMSGGAGEFAVQVFSANSTGIQPRWAGGAGNGI